MGTRIEKSSNRILADRLLGVLPVRLCRISHMIPFLMTLGLACLPSYAQYSGGAGTPEAPYQIATAQDLIDLGDNPNDYDRHFILTADIDLSGHPFQKAVIDFFYGSLDGNGGGRSGQLQMVLSRDAQIKRTRPCHF